MAREKEVMGEINMIMENTINITYHTSIKMPAYRENKFTEIIEYGRSVCLSSSPIEI